MAVKPLQSLNFGQPIYTSGNHTIVQLKSNFGESNYSFKSNVFQCHVASAIGVIDDDKKWLVFNGANGNVGDAYDVEVSEYKDGKKTVDKPASDAAIKAHFDNLWLTACLTNGIESMEILAELSAELQVMLFNRNLQMSNYHTVKFADDFNKVAVKQKLIDLVCAWMSGSVDNPAAPWEIKPEIVDLSDELSKVGMFYIPITDLSLEEYKPIVFKTGSPLKPIIKHAIPPFKTESLYPFEGLGIDLPALKVRGSSGSYGVKAETTEEKIAARIKFLQQYFPSTDLAGLVDKIQENKSSQELFEILIKIMG